MNNAQKIQELLIVQEEIQKKYDEMRMFKHEYKNTLISLRGYIEDGDFDHLSQYVISLTNEFCEFEKNDYIGVSQIADAGLRFLVLNKICLAKKMQVHFSIKVSSAFEVRSFSRKHLSMVVGILLDNAIEAAKDSDEKRVEVFFANNEREGIIEIKNSYKQKPNLGRMFAKGYSEKEGHTGLGLYRLKKTLSNCETAFTEIKIMKNYFKFIINFI